MSKPPPSINPAKYSHSPAHHAVVIGDHTALNALIASLPRRANPDKVRTESDSLAQQRISEQISAVIDRRDVPNKETPLHLAVLLNDAVSARALAAAGANYSLQNAAGWNPLQEALCRHCTEVGRVLLRLREPSAWAKWRRRLPRMIGELRRMRDFYMEISFHFENSLIPFFSKMAPSDTYKIWKIDGNLRADFSIAGFDGMKIKRGDTSLLFLGDGDGDHNIKSGSLLVLKRHDSKMVDCFKNAGRQMTESEIAAYLAKTAVHRPGMDVSKAELVARTNWRRQPVTESVGEWKSKVYEMNNVSVRLRVRKIVSNNSDASGSHTVEVEEVDEGGGDLAKDKHKPGHRRSNSEDAKNEDKAKSKHPGHKRSNSDFAGEEKKAATAGAQGQQGAAVQETVKSVQPSVWLTDQFPLQKEELLPLLDILVNKVKAMRKMRELFSTTLPPGTFPVKLAIPVVPSVRVVITFSKFVDIQSTDEFYTPPSSPTKLGLGPQPEQKSKANVFSKHSGSGSGPDDPAPFAIPSGYTWSTVSNKKKAAN